MIINGYYRTLDGEIGKCVSAAVLNHFLEETLKLEKTITLVQLEFDDGSYEWWLNTQLEEF